VQPVGRELAVIPTGGGEESWEAEWERQIGRGRVGEAKRERHNGRGRRTLSLLHILLTGLFGTDIVERSDESLGQEPTLSNYW
jgi:hypothetical protein